MAVADRFDRVKPSPAIKPGISAGETNRFTNLVPKPTPATVAEILRNQGATTGEANRFAKLPTAPTMAQIQRSAGATTGEANRFANIASNVAAARTGTTPTGSIIAAPPSPMPAPGGTAPGGTTPGGTTPGGTTPGGTTPGGTTPGGTTPGGATEQPAEETKIDAQAMLAALINQLLEGDFIGFQGQRAAELRRLQNLRNQLYGDAEMGSLGAIERQRQLDVNARRRLAASRAVSGMLAGGAYAGTQRGLGTVQRAEQDFGIQEMERPFREQVAADRLREFGLEFTPSGRIFNLSDFGAPTDLLGGWTRQTFSGREAAARARLAAIQQLAQRGIQI
jgi:hypothetical protein